MGAPRNIYFKKWGNKRRLGQTEERKREKERKRGGKGGRNLRENN